MDAEKVGAAAFVKPVTLRVPAEVAFDFDQLVRIQRDLFEQLGHGGCYSGADFRIRIEDDWVVRGGKVQPALGA